MLFWHEVRQPTPSLLDDNEILDGRGDRKLYRLRFQSEQDRACVVFEAVRLLQEALSVIGPPLLEGASRQRQQCPVKVRSSWCAAKLGTPLS
jgi:hypothetical protein